MLRQVTDGCQFFAIIYVDDLDIMRNNISFITHNRSKMAQLTVTGDIDPLLHISLTKGESIYCESGAMVMMEKNLELKGSARGGFGSAIMRKISNGESFFQQTIEAKQGDGDCLLAANLPGAIQLLEIGNKQYTLGDGAFLAATSNVELKVRTQSLGNAMFGNGSGFFVSETSGSGKIAISGFGSIFKLDVKPGEDIVVDNNHVICWQSTVNASVEVSTKSGGIISNLINSVKSGEGVILRFKGEGEIYISSKNQSSFMGWIKKYITP
jgi:uncharacterized protein (TIGR00266 family)